MKKKPTRDPDYEVGYGRPPRHSRFKKGQSGNPAGRRKGTQNTRALIEKEGAEPITITENGVRKVISKREAASKAFFARVMKGDIGAFKVLLEIDRADGAAAAAGSSYKVSKADLDALRRHADWIQVIEAAEAELEDDEAE